MAEKINPIARLGAYAGNNPDTGNRNGGGVKKNAVRHLCVDGFEAGIPRIVALVNDPQSAWRAVVQGMDLLGKYGIGAKSEIHLTNDHVLEAIADVFVDMFGADSATEFLQKCKLRLELA